MTDTIETLRASLAAATAREGRLREALKTTLEALAMSQMCITPTWDGTATHDSAVGIARAALKDPAP